MHTLSTRWRTYLGLVNVGLFAALGGALSSCGESVDTQKENQPPLPSSYSPVQGEPPSEASFEQALIGRYLADQTQYDAQPNELSKHKFEEAADQKLCQLIKSYTPFKDWVGTVTQIDQPNSTVMFQFDIGNGFSLRNSPDHDLSLESPAYNALAKIRVGDIVNVSGVISVDGIVGSCDDYPTWRLRDHKIGDRIFYVQLTKLNGASTLATPP